MRLRLEKQGQGENPGSWGAPKLNTVLDLIDDATDGITTKQIMASGQIILQANTYAVDEARRRVLRLTGSLPGPVDVVVPAVEKVLLVDDKTTRGGHALRIGISGGPWLALVAGMQWVYCDGSVCTSDRTATGAALLQAADIGAARAAIGAVSQAQLPSPPPPLPPIPKMPGAGATDLLTANAGEYLTLPAGGTWEWDTLYINTATGGIGARACGVNAGGTVISTVVTTGFRHLCKVWRIA